MPAFHGFNNFYRFRYFFYFSYTYLQIKCYKKNFQMQTNDIEAINTLNEQFLKEVSCNYS